MSEVETESTEIPPFARPSADKLAFDLDAALASVVMVHTEIPGDAFTASILGTERSGSGVVIREDGLVVTIGYLVTEAETVWLTGESGVPAPAHVVGYDFVSGFGLVQAMTPLSAPPLAIGTAAGLESGHEVVVAGCGGAAHALNARVVGKRTFAGYWEYVLDEAIFTTPAHPDWGGTACIAADGRLVGIGSLFVQEAAGPGSELQGNMIVPIDLLPPIIDDMLKRGRPNRAPRPWLGMFTAEGDDGLVVMGLAEGAPAHLAGVQPGDLVMAVASIEVNDLAEMLRTVWSRGPAGSEIPITVMRDGRVETMLLRSADRHEFLKRPRLH